MTVDVTVAVVVGLLLGAVVKVVEDYRKFQAEEKAKEDGKKKKTTIVTPEKLEKNYSEEREKRLVSWVTKIEKELTDFYKGNDPMKKAYTYHSDRSIAEDELNEVILRFSTIGWIVAKKKCEQRYGYYGGSANNRTDEVQFILELKAFPDES